MICLATFWLVYGFLSNFCLLSKTLVLKKKIWRNICSFFDNFCGISVSWLAFAISKLKFPLTTIPYVHVKRGDSCCVLRTSPIMSMFACFLYFTRRNNWIVDRIWNRAVVTIFYNFKITYNIGKEGIQNLRCIKSLSTIQWLKWSFSLLI